MASSTSGTRPAATMNECSGAFYSNFTNKEALLEAVIEAGLGEPFLADTNRAPARRDESDASAPLPASTPR
jgi:AcrR family transcriptional regulator